MLQTKRNRSTLGLTIEHYKGKREMFNHLLSYINSPIGAVISGFLTVALISWIIFRRSPGTAPKEQPPRQSRGKMCPTCKDGRGDNDTHCYRCGATLVPNPVCDQCGTELYTNPFVPHCYCTKCGAKTKKGE